MSSLPITHDSDGIIYDVPLDEFWSLYQEILLEEPINGTDHLPHEHCMVEKYPLLLLNEAATNIIGSADQNVENINNNGSKLMENNNSIIRNSKRRKILRNRNEKYGGISSTSSSVAKKLDHNAKERIRRMKVNASFLALRELLPRHSSTRSKKRSNLRAPAILDRALKYIPELENEIELLISKKENVKSEVKKNKKINNYCIIDGTKSSSQQQISCNSTVSVNKVCEGEAIVQICVGKEDDEHQQGSAFSNLLQRVEDEGVCIISASTIYVCETRTCYHLHIQMNQISEDVGVDNFIAELQEKLWSWLR